MRSLFIFLLALNISYLIWEVAFSEKNATSAHQELKSGIQVLTLLSEKSENIAPQKAAGLTAEVKMSKSTPKSEAQDLQSKTCFSLGPFFEEDSIKKLEAKLNRSGFNPKRKSITDKEPKSYWLYMPAANTMEEAKVMADKLNAAKVKDYFIIRTGKNSKAISLGLYNGYTRAKLRKNDLLKLGFESKVKTRYRDVTRHWLDLQEIQSNPLKDELWNQEDKDVVLQKVVRPCVDPLPENS